MTINSDPQRTQYPMLAYAVAYYEFGTAYPEYLTTGYLALEMSSRPRG